MTNSSFEYDAVRGVCYRTLACYGSFASRYRVGWDGSVWSKVTGTWKELRQTPDPAGYQVVDVGKFSLVHRLVLWAFVGPCPEGQQCRHLDGKPGNNRLENLCWGTAKEDREDQRRLGTLLLGEDVFFAKLTEAEVVSVKIAWNACDERISRFADRWAKKLNVHRDTICCILRGLSWEHVLPTVPLRRNELCGNQRLLENVVVEIKRKWNSSSLSQRAFAQAEKNNYPEVSHHAIIGIVSGGCWAEVLADEPLRKTIANKDRRRLENSR